ncbi:MAG: flagellar biosynthesis protein FlhA [Shewanellaceae bacterium]|nr:flagellar biosynthesis protein FlhA [Shewanellaceae bacterium]
MDIISQARSYKDRLVASKILQGLGAPLLLIAILAMVVLPIPPFILDVLFSFNIAIALVVLLVAVYTPRPLDFGSFPSALLIATILRLALNVASTRVVLLEGHQGADAAGKVIEAFGNVVVGGNYTVGFIVFMILVIINFVVITKGAGRISEVNARFTLDAMPGKQMAIDADLNAGLIEADEAKARREEIVKEADFYGAMDGASKFVRGDAIAGILILFINVIGGLLIGTIQYDLTVSAAAEYYILLTIGDGIVAQIPGLVLSISAALIVTRQNETGDMGEIAFAQMFDTPRSLAVASGVLLLIGLVPGMPWLFFFVGLLIGGMAYYVHVRNKKNTVQEHEKAEKEVAEAPPPELGWNDVKHVDVLSLEIGFRLISLVDVQKGGQLLTRIKGVRRKLSQELGFLIPPVHIKDNLDLAPNSYTINISGVCVGQAEIQMGCDLAINPGQVYGNIDGYTTQDPAFGLDAVWIAPELKEKAQTLGYTVVDIATVIAPHLNHILFEHASQLLGYDEAQQLFDLLTEKSPKLIEGLIPDVLPLGQAVKVLQNLLNEGVSIRDLRTVVQTLVEYAPKSKDPELLTAAVRIALKRMIVQELCGQDNEIPVITLSPDLEQILHQSMQANEGETPHIEPGLAERLQQSLKQASHQQDMQGQPSILLTSGMLRTTLSRFVRHAISGLRVLSYQEIPDEKQIKIVASVGQ